LAAGADAVYCGLKAFSARMASDNFQMEEMAKLTRLAHEKGAKVYVALNALVKTTELASMAEMLYQLRQQVKPDGLIIQDMAVLQLARQANFQGELHLSTLANLSLASALPLPTKFWESIALYFPENFISMKSNPWLKLVRMVLGLRFSYMGLCAMEYQDGVTGAVIWEVKVASGEDVFNLAEENMSIKVKTSVFSHVWI
jgi:hypothetical protein